LVVAYYYSTSSNKEVFSYRGWGTNHMTRDASLFQET